MVRNISLFGQLSVFTTYGPPDAGFFTSFPPVRG